jgi:hypothetical protein
MLAYPGVVPLTATPGLLLITLAAKIIRKGFVLTVSSLDIEVKNSLGGIVQTAKTNSRDARS